MSGNLYPEGIDCAWLASDREGRVAVFMTAGAGPIPTKALDCECVPLADVEMRLCEMPKISTIRLLVTVKRPDDFVDLAERGIYVYDWRDTQWPIHSPLDGYKPVAIPDTPINISMLAKDLAELAQDLKFDTVFSENLVLDVSMFTSCSYSESTTTDEIGRTY